MSIYRSWGFQRTPFDTNPVPADFAGESLLVGREPELASVLLRLRTAPKAVTIEGANGIGKTSIVNVASFQALNEFLNETAPSLLLPCRTRFQLEPSTETNEFARKVLFEVAATLLEWKARLLKDGRKLPKSKRIDVWMNSPLLGSISAGLTSAGYGLSVGGSVATNTSEGFTAVGLQTAIDEWLAALFEDDESGGVVCVVDNLELLETSERARAQLERLRDVLLNKRGLRWVLCGSTGIVLSVASSARLGGYLHAPLEVKSLEPAAIPQVLNARVQGAKDSNGAQYLPLAEDSFRELARILRGNLRETLSSADAYCLWIVDSKRSPQSEADKRDAFAAWKLHQVNELKGAVAGYLTPAVEKVFRRAVALGGAFSPGQFADFEYDSPQALRPHVKTLEQAQLVASSIDEEDKRRRTVTVTPKGWFFAETLN